MHYIFWMAALLILTSCSDANQLVDNLDLDKSTNVIYGQDGRQETELESNPMVRQAARATVAIINSKNIINQSDSWSYIDTDTYGETHNLCRDEKFYHQINPVHCSGSLISGNRVLTAGHCVQTQEQCDNIKFVFDFKTENGFGSRFVDPSKIYGCQRIVKMEYHWFKADWAIVELDREVTDRLPVTLGDSDGIEVDHPVTVIGFPSGVPQKVTRGGKIRDNRRDDYFVASVDTYGGNSGSPIFSDVTGHQIGILVRGEQDFEYDEERQCQRSFQCEEDDCRGEDVTRINLPKKYVDFIPGSEEDVPDDLDFDEDNPFGHFELQ